MGKKTPIIEAFGTTIQGEGALIGAPTLFLRTGGCGYRCTWCDTMFAVDPVQVKKNATYMQLEEIQQLLESLPWAPYLTISGGDPCMHKGLGDVISWVKTKGIKVAVETQGELWQDWLLNVDYLTFSPKPPSSGNITDIDDFMKKCIKAYGNVQHLTVKPVVFNEADLSYAIDLYNKLRSAEQNLCLYDTFCFQPGTIHEEMMEFSKGTGNKRDQIMDSERWLIERLIKESQTNGRISGLWDSRTRILPQLHAAIWPDIKQGV